MQNLDQEESGGDMFNFSSEEDNNDTNQEVERKRHDIGNVGFQEKRTMNSIKLFNYINYCSAFIIIHLVVQEIRRFFSSTKKFKQLESLASKFQFISKKVILTILQVLEKDEKILWIGRPETKRVFKGTILIFIGYSFGCFLSMAITRIMLEMHIFPYLLLTPLILSLSIGRVILKLSKIPLNIVYIVTNKKIITYSSPEISGVILTKPQLNCWNFSDIDILKKKEYKEEGISIIFHIQKLIKWNFSIRSCFGFLYLFDDTRLDVLRVLKKRRHLFKFFNKRKMKKQIKNNTLNNHTVDQFPKQAKLSSTKNKNNSKEI
ncbi:hypothetical protein M0813_13701 [Anaeramoeba flamelloides]|uniref:Uncharacterized protein n=1 Tax=Anaeramoeba flamelloides TaxID=1746091 RepID=A0ABQ8Z7Z8_9EUKA|nr:hypothetical protein M0813_13701 [Anaeramoeba flamelloides]